jgi:hypothetical protein
MIAPHEMQILEQQLGRPPRGVRAIERFCPAGHPQVIRVYPLIDAKPFPTLFWLSCPSLVQQISRLEYRGVITTLEQLIQDDASFRADYHKNHRAYVQERWEQLSPEDCLWVQTQGLRSAFLTRGIGGLQDWNQVKCLHMHFAHHRARESVIGRWIEEHYTIRECET